MPVARGGHQRGHAVIALGEAMSRTSAGGSAGAKCELLCSFGGIGSMRDPVVQVCFRLES